MFANSLLSVKPVIIFFDIVCFVKRLQQSLSFVSVLDHCTCSVLAAADTAGSASEWQPTVTD